METREQKENISILFSDIIYQKQEVQTETGEPQSEVEQEDAAGALREMNNTDKGMDFIQGHTHMLQLYVVLQQVT